MVEDVFARRAIVGDATHGGCQLLVVGGHGAGIAQSAEVLTGIEAVSSCMAEGASFTMRGDRIAHRTVGLSIILDEKEVVATADVGNTLCVGTTSIEVDNHHGTGTRRDGLLYQGVVNLESVDTGLHQHGLQPVLSNGEDRSYVGVGRDDDLVALPQHIIIYIRA